MQYFAGLHKKSIAGISRALVIFFSSTVIFIASLNAFADEATLTQAALTQTTSTTAPASAINSVNTTSSSEIATLTNSGIAVTAPVNTPKPAAQKTSSSASQLANLIGGLALIIVLIYGLSWFVKRFTQGGFMHNPGMKVVSALPLGTRERLMLVDVGGKQLLLGVTATQINTLHVFDEPVIQTEKVQPVASDFSQKLMAILQQKNFSPADDSAHKKSNS